MGGNIELATAGGAALGLRCRCIQTAIGVVVQREGLTEFKEQEQSLVSLVRCASGNVVVNGGIIVVRAKAFGITDWNSGVAAPIIPFVTRETGLIGQST